MSIEVRCGKTTYPLDEVGAFQADQKYVDAFVGNKWQIIDEVLVNGQRAVADNKLSVARVLPYLPAGEFVMIKRGAYVRPALCKFHRSGIIRWVGLGDRKIKVSRRNLSVIKSVETTNSQEIARDPELSESRPEMEAP